MKRRRGEVRWVRLDPTLGSEIIRSPRSYFANSLATRIVLVWIWMVSSTRRA